MKIKHTYIVLTYLLTSQLLLSQSINWSYNVGFAIQPQSPAVADDGTIYIGSEDNANFHAINPDGTLKWVYDQLPDNVYSSASIGADGTIYVGSKDDYLHAINPDGSQKWVVQLPDFTNIIYSTPAIAIDGTIYIGSDDNKFYAINPDGTQKWSFPGGGNFRGTPAVAADKTIYITNDDDNLYAINPDGTQKWAFNVGGNAQSGLALQSDGTIIVGVDQGGSTGAVFAVNPDGTEKWGITVVGRISVCAPAIAEDGTIYIGTKEGHNMLALNPADGSQIWEYVMEDGVSIINSSPAVGDDGRIYFGSFDNHLYCLNSDGTLDFKVNLNDNIWSSPAISSSGNLIVGSYDGKVYSIDIPSTGLADSNWPMFGKNTKHTSSDDKIIINWAYDIGFRIEPQSPAIADDGTIYIGSEDNTNFHAINPDGSLKWTYSDFEDNVYSSASIGIDGTIYVGTKNNAIHAIKSDGTQLWEFPLSGEVIYSTPAVANDGSIYIGTEDNKLMAINPDGTEKWTYNATTKIRSTPSISANGTVYFATDDDLSGDKLHALNPTDGTEIWNYNFGGGADVEGCIVLDNDGTIFVGLDKGETDGSVMALNPDGTLKWESTNTGRVFSSPAIYNGAIYFGTKDTNMLYALDISNGSVLWSYTTGDIINSSPAIGDDGKIYFGSHDNHLYGLNPDSTFIFRVNLNDNVWSSPAITPNGDLIVGSYDGKLYSIDIPSTGLADSNWPMFGKNLKHTSSNDTTERLITYTDAEGYDPINPNGLIMDYGILCVEDGTAPITEVTTLKNITVKPQAVLDLGADLTSNISFESDGLGSGQIADIDGITITGEVSVERFIPASDSLRRAFRYLTSSLDSYESIRENWQENGNNPSGYGTHITGSTLGENGFDVSQTGNASMYLFDNTVIDVQNQNIWLPVPNTDVRKLYAGEPYVIMIRGDRNYDLNSNPVDPPNSNVTLRTKGDLKIGDFSPPLSSIDAFFSLVGNPYQSKVNFKDISFSGNIKSTLMWHWNPNLGNLGAYEIFDENEEQIIQPGQSFFVQNSEVVSTPPSLTYSESSKEPSAVLTDVFSTSSVAIANLELYNNNNLLDKVKFRFESNANNAIDDYDGGKLGNNNEILASVNSDILMALERRNIPSDNEIISLSISQLQFTEYILKIKQDNWLEDVQVYAVDHYLETESLIDHNSDYSFTVDFTIPESVSENRFDLKFYNTNLNTNDNDNKNRFVIHPNPASDGFINLELKNFIQGKAEMAIYNYLGQKVRSKEVENIVNMQRLELNKLTSGLYIVELKVNNQVHRKKLIIN